MDERILREQVLTLLDGGRAHTRARDVLAGFPAKARGLRPPGFAHSAWQLLEHLRRAQRDILDYCQSPDYRAPRWPDDYWPKQPAPKDAAAWQRSMRAFLGDLRECTRVARNRRVDLTASIAHLDGVGWLRQLLLIAAHNSWHLGQLMQLRRAVEATARRPA